MNILIIEDEARIAKRLERMTTDFFTSSITTLKVIDSLAEGLSYIHNNTMDLVMLDLNLNGEDGFHILKTAVAESFDTIIVSAYKEHALSAFEYGVTDFVSKPFNQERLIQAFKRVINKERINKTEIKFLAVKKRRGIQLISIDDILYLKGAGIYAEIFLKNGDRELHDKSLEKLEQLLPESFERLHKSYLVKISEVKGIVVQSGSKYAVELKNGSFLPIGRTKYKSLKEKWI